mgnify:FL=1|jgi:hypothetical protein|tara:strand:+ start:3244 stop:3738 length:495 start_codon:yes stop_codon:yes gene_type:complete
MTKDQWASCVQVMKLKWPNFSWQNDTIISAYESLKNIEIYYIERSIEQSFKSGADFPPSPSNIYANAMEIARYDIQESPALPMERGIKLNDYLSSMNYESFAHAMFEVSRKRFLAGKSETHEDFDYTKEWSNGGKEEWLAHSGLAAAKFSQVLENIEEDNNGIS